MRARWPKRASRSPASNIRCRATRAVSDRPTSTPFTPADSMSGAELTRRALLAAGSALGLAPPLFARTERDFRAFKGIRSAAAQRFTAPVERLDTPHRQSVLKGKHMYETAMHGGYSNPTKKQNHI